MAEWVVGPLFYRNGVLNAGEVVETHTHNFDHVTEIYSGSFRITVRAPGQDPETADYVAGQQINVPKENEHRLEALEDGSEYRCVFPHREPTGEVSETFTGFMDAYG